MKNSKKLTVGELSKFDVVDYLKTDKDMSQYFHAVLEDGDPNLFFTAIGDIAKAKWGLVSNTHLK